jgi:chloride channel 3/4/5
VKDSYRSRAVHSRSGIRGRLWSAFDSAQGWFAAAIIGILTACIAFLVDVAVATVSDWKIGYCKTNRFQSREGCCGSTIPGPPVRYYEQNNEIVPRCPNWHDWSQNYGGAFGIYVGFALVWGVLSASVTMMTKTAMPAAERSERSDGSVSNAQQPVPGKTIYLAAGSGIPEIKTILSGFVIPNILDLKVLIVKAVGAIFAVSTGMCLGKEGPFVHISTCVAYLVAQWFPKYKENGRKLRELLSAGCAAGLSVAFGAPIGGVLFSYEEISTYFPRKVLWRAFLCSLFAAMVLRALNPTGTGKLVLFETNYGTSYDPIHYLAFILLGIAGGLFGGVFCKANFLWSQWFRKFAIVKNNPVLECFLVVLATALIQYPNPATREPGDMVIKNLLLDCRGDHSSWVCVNETKDDRRDYIGWLIYGTFAKLLLTIITFGVKVPSGIIIPSLDAGAFFGRLIGQAITGISPGIFAMVGAAAFLAGVSRMTISLCVIMFELTGELEYVVPHMVAILVAKWVADAMEPNSVYDLAQTVLGHPFLDGEHALKLAQRANATVESLIPPAQTMQEITVEVPKDGRVPRSVLATKLKQLKRRGLLDAGLVLVQSEMLRGYLAEGELEFGLTQMSQSTSDVSGVMVRVLGEADDSVELNLSSFVDRTPLTVPDKAPAEIAVEMFGKLGLRYLCVVQEGSGKLVGVSYRFLLHSTRQDHRTAFEQCLLIR